MRRYDRVAAMGNPVVGREKENEIGIEFFARGINAVLSRAHLPLTSAIVREGCVRERSFENDLDEPGEI